MSNRAGYLRGKVNGLNLAIQYLENFRRCNISYLDKQTRLSLEGTFEAIKLSRDTATEIRKYLDS